jgi:hypothetical protein
MGIVVFIVFLVYLKLPGEVTVSLLASYVPFWILHILRIDTVFPWIVNLFPPTVIVAFILCLLKTMSDDQIHNEMERDKIINRKRY